MRYRKEKREKLAKIANDPDLYAEFEMTVGLAVVKIFGGGFILGMCTTVIIILIVMELSK